MIMHDAKKCNENGAHLRDFMDLAGQPNPLKSSMEEQRSAVIDVWNVNRQHAAERHPAAAVCPEVDAFVRSNGNVVPADVCCPLAGRWMREPVLTPAGKVYERDSIYEFWQTSDADPVAGVSLADRRAVPSRSTQRKCEAFKQAVLLSHPEAAQLFS
jgi:hypothetical protein